MIVRKLKEASGTEREVRGDNWTSRRLLLETDGMGFSLHDTVIHGGTSTRMWYRHHVEAVYCIEGKGTITVTATGDIHQIEAGTVYALDGHEEHVLTAETAMRMVCVFNPALSGKETHDEQGAYPPPSAAQDEPKGARVDCNK
tara:strand:- start:67 stop:495 length:429 start_codon:yes stop_codon:yes gene_type:complete